ncbi:MAG TPA: hypothetical protein P5186_07540 [Candidatus Paceibacterota bacterium]|nr:hypothetical protein [Verrucomicrobiota bacterium]HRY47882.1 hypothetical protein [Candidatus Paceibacterota bacterium]HSA00374.1 hypothetical protein [Candidatus Paceibacterota bacterium]
MGANESESVIELVQWAIPFWGSIPWLLLAGVLWIDRRRHLGNSWLLAAFVVGWAFLRALYFAMPYPLSGLVDVVHPVLQALLFGMVIMWLIASRLATSTRGATFLGMLAATGVSSALMLCASIDMDNSQTTVPSFIGLLVVWPTTVISLMMASALCRHRGGVLRFSLFLALSCFGLLWTVLFILLLLSNNLRGWAICLAMAGGLDGTIVLMLLPIHAMLFLHPGQQSRLTSLLHRPVARDNSPAAA